MNLPIKISDTWLKASILGATWAASEIILGSFLHNLRIPFKGNILTTIAFVLLIAASYRWKDRGLFWRSGLVCALMKTLSPSAVIFGPMVAIFMEALLLDISVRVLGRNLVGFTLGAVLAMTWILVQKILNLLLFYGVSIADLYSQLMRFAEQQINFSVNLVWGPILLLLGINILFGIAAVTLGVISGRRLLNHPNSVDFNLAMGTHSSPIQTTTHFPYSIPWLFANAFLLPAMLMLISMGSFWLWAPASLATVFVWVYRYKRAMRQLSKPKFWIFFIAITMLSAFAITAIQSNGGDILAGLLVGLQMNFRAAIVISGFTVLGTELYNPRIRQFFASTYFKQLPVALELAFDTLPIVISRLPSVRSILHKPVLVIVLLVNLAEKRFHALRNSQQRPIFLIVGGRKEGKSRTVSELIKSLLSKGVTVGGIVSERIISNDTTTGYYLVNISNGAKVQFLEKSPEMTPSRIGRFKIIPDAMMHGNELLQTCKLKGKELVVIDEVGKLELDGEGWAERLFELIEANTHTIVLTVRREYVNAVMDRFGIENHRIFDVSTFNGKEIAERVVEAIPSPQNITGIILAGGQSSRMGQDKSCIQFRGSKLIDYPYRLMQGCCNQTIVSTNSSPFILPNVTYVSDNYKDVGPLAGLESALKLSTTPWNFVAPCDMPFLSKELFMDMLKEIHGVDCVVPVFTDGKVTPLVGVYNRSILPAIVKQIESGDYKVMNLLKKVRVRYHQTDSKSIIINLNSPNDLESFHE